MEQKIISADNGYAEFDAWIKEKGCRNILAVADDSLKFMDTFRNHLDSVRKSGTDILLFQDFRQF